MKPRRLTGLFAVSAILACVGATHANIRLRVPGDIDSPLYVSNVAPFIALDGSLFAVQDGEWAAIAFIRPIDQIPTDVNLLEADFGAFRKPMTVDGFAIFKAPEDRVPMITEAHGLGAVPVWFVAWTELQAAADHILTLAELEAMPSLLEGTASFFQEQNHFTNHQVSHLTAVARGDLEDGRSFYLRAVEVDLELVEVSIRFW